MKHGDVLSSQLSPCPSFPCCISSRNDATPRHRIEPFAATEDPIALFERLKVLLTNLPRTMVFTATDTYLHAVCRTRFGFSDDVEFRLCLTGRVIHVRSASRIGIWDFGVNRRRIEKLRRQLHGR